jgi:phenylacetate-CoA ligase
MRPARESLLTRLRWSAYLAATAPRQGRFPFRAGTAIERAQARRVRSAVSHAYRYVPYYRETLDRLGLRPRDFRSAADLARLPIIERHDVQGDPERFLSRAQPVESYVSLGSSGTSGDPLTVCHDQFTLFQAAGHRQRRAAPVMKLAGKRFRYRHLRIRPEGGHGDVTSRAFHRRTFISASVQGAQLRISQQNPMARNVELINQFRPDVISSFGSYIEALFLYLHRERVDFHRPRVVTYSSEALAQPVRRLINDEFGIPVLGSYGSVEALHIGFECEEHLGYHLNDDIYPVRIVDAEGGEVEDGQTGEVVVSNLVTRGTMLFNYRLGDLAKKLPARCPCGRSLPLLSYLEGRIGDWIETPSGEPMHPITVKQLLNAEEGVWRFQLVQETPQRFRLDLVAKDDCDRDATRARLARGFTERLGHGTAVEIRFVDSLPRARSGKVPPVVS